MQISDQVKNSFLTILFIFLGIFIYTKFAGSIPLSIISTQTTKTTMFSAEGTGKATVIPNTAIISLGVTKTSLTISSSQNEVNTSIDKIIKDLKSLGIEEKNIKTTNYSISPNYDYTSGRQNITGYTVTQNLEVKIKPIDKANQAIDKATEDGANLVGGANFTIDDKTKNELEEKARKEAVKTAKEKAKSLASAAGINLGRIVDVKESGGYPEPIRYNALSVGGGELEKQPTKITPGENIISLTVTLYYEIR